MDTRYIDAALDHLTASGEALNEEDAARLSPLGDAHINVHGRYAFAPPAGDALRPLRDPNLGGDEP